jgi:hypothetical protein
LLDRSGSAEAFPRSLDGLGMTLDQARYPALRAKAGRRVDVAEPVPEHGVHDETVNGQKLLSCDEIRDESRGRIELVFKGAAAVASLGTNLGAHLRRIPDLTSEVR